MAGKGCAVLTVLLTCQRVTSQGQRDSSPHHEDGLNRHKELVMFSCLGAVLAMSVTIVFFFWYVVDRTKGRIRHFENHLPNVVRRFRQEVAEVEENDNGRIMMAGVTTSTTEVSPLEASRGRIRLTSYTQNQDVSTETDVSEATGMNDQTDTPTNEPARRASKAPDGAESKDFVYVDGEYLPKDFVAVEGYLPPYAYDNPVYDHTSAAADGSSDLENNNKGNRKAKKKGKGKDSKLSVYESHV